MTSKDEDNRQDRKMDLPSWMDETNDAKFAATKQGDEDDDEGTSENTPLLFGSAPATKTRDNNNKKGLMAETEQQQSDITLPSVALLSSSDHKKDDDDNDEDDDDDHDEEQQEDRNKTSKAKKKTSSKRRPIGRRRPEQESSSRPHIPRQNPCLWIFHFIKGSAVVGSLCLLLTQWMPFVTDHYHLSTLFSLLNMILKGYISLFCILFILVEVDLPIAILRNSMLLHAYFSRGFLYSFLGLICSVEASSDRVQSFLSSDDTNGSSYEITWSAIFMQVSAWLVCAVGLTYMLLGVLCLQPLRNRLREQERQAWRTYHEEMREWRRNNNRNNET